MNNLSPNDGIAIGSIGVAGRFIVTFGYQTMEQLQQFECCELRSRTWRLLREREHILRSKHSPLLQFLVMPSFTDSWCIDLVRTNGVTVAYYTVWRMTHDIEAFSTAIERLKHPRPYLPTLESTKLDASPESLDLILDRLSSIVVPLSRVRNSIGLDGTLFELQIGDGLTGIMLQWHNELPDEWSLELADVLSMVNDIASLHTTQASAQADARARRNRAQ